MISNDFKNEIREELQGNIIPFWKALRDDEHGGFYGHVAFDLSVQKTADKGGIFISRILWFFSECFLTLKSAELLDYAAHAYKFLCGMFDEQNGGIYWSATFDGAPADTTKHVYVQAFAVYALSAYYKASGDTAALDKAVELYNLIETTCRDEYSFGESYDKTFGETLVNEHLSENDVIAEKTMNTLLHAFEGFSGLHEALNGCNSAVIIEVERSMRRILGDFKSKIYNGKLRRQEVFFDKHMKSIIDLQSYGHDIESAWLIEWGAGLLGDAELSREIAAITSELAESVMERAYRNSYVWNERVRADEDKTSVWWVQAEAILGFLNHYKKHPHKPEFKRAAEDIWEYIKAKIIDSRPGSEWFYKLDESGTPDGDEPFAGEWKCPYHNGRMCIRLLAVVL
ncbi:MAG: AGE family epimerase/isomerase [Oscillospiraceae bacterium]|nr:AGE family epimerase/isomerase [Oscillospiraceae bacterium]